jgi:hypothetical protein
MHSQVFCCNTCHSPVALVVQIGGDLTYECVNPRCQRVVSVDCPEALALVEDVTLELHAKEVIHSTQAQAL